MLEEVIARLISRLNIVASKPVFDEKKLTDKQWVA
jgi:hypothetical protein